MTSDIGTLESLAAFWAALRDMRIEAPGAQRSFAQALADENGWTLARARAVDLEYRRFLYLAATAGPEVTPSRAVDRAWHLHLTYTHHYWEVLCEQILRRPLHHLPGSGGSEDEARLTRQYRETLLAYVRAFGRSPPPDIWPRPHQAPPADAAAAEEQPWLARHARFFAASAVLSAMGALLWGAVGFLGAFMLAAAVLAVRDRNAPAERRRRARANGSCGAGSCGGGPEEPSWSSANCGGGGCGGD